MSFKIIDISGDIGLCASGISLREAFINAGLGMFSLITDIGKIDDKIDYEINISSESLEGLVVNYLNELIFHFDTYGFIGSKIEVEEFSDYHIKAKVRGDYFNPSFHSRGLLIKAATYHDLRIEKIDDIYQITVIFDI
jgi:Uncharacterized conserved protein